MVVYNLYIFNRNGQCVFYREWLRKKQTKMTAEEVRLCLCEERLEGMFCRLGI